MKIFAFAALAAACLCFGCQKTPEISPEDTPAQTVRSEAETGQNDTAESPKTEDSALAAQDTDAAANHKNEEKSGKIPADRIHNNVIWFEDVGIDETLLKPEFSSKAGNPNGTFALLKPGIFRYYLVSEKDDAVSESQYADYRSKVFEHVKSIADNGDIFAFNIQTAETGDKLEKMPEIKMNVPLQIAYAYHGQKTSVYVDFKKYQPGKFSDTNKPIYAVYVMFSLEE